MPTANQGSFRLFRFAGIDLFLHWSWFLVAAFEISGRGRRYPSLSWNVAEYLALFFIVTLHEFGHALACRQVGGTANKIVLWPLGGVAYVSPPQRPGATLWSISAGPLVNVILFVVLSAAIASGRASGWFLVAPYARVLLWAVWSMNLGLLIFNMLPIYPLDGGQILRSLLWFVIGPVRSLKVATTLGIVGGTGLIALAFWLHSFWIGAISLFMLFNCWAGLQHAQLLSTAATGRAPNGLRSEYTEIFDPKLQFRLNLRYEREIASLQSFGFTHFGHCLEVLPPYSALLRFPLVLAMRNKHVLAFPNPARLAVGSVLLAYSSPGSIASCMGTGIKFHTGFSDGSLLISSTYRIPLVPPPNSRIIKNPPVANAAEAWEAHRKRVAELEAQGVTVNQSYSFADYVEISKRKDAMLLES